MTRAKIPIGLGPGLFSSFFLSAPNRTSLWLKRKIQTGKPDFTFENTPFLPKPQQKSDKTQSNYRTYQVTKSVSNHVCKFDVAMLPQPNVFFFCKVKLISAKAI